MEESSWKTFVQHCAAELLNGELTTQRLRQAVDDPQLRSIAAIRDFRADLLGTCDRIRDQVTKDDSVLLEIDAAARRLAKLVRSHTDRTTVLIDRLAHPEVPEPASRSLNAEPASKQNRAQ